MDYLQSSEKTEFVRKAVDFMIVNELFELCKEEIENGNRKEKQIASINLHTNFFTKLLVLVV